MGRTMRRWVGMVMMAGVLLAGCATPEGRLAGETLRLGLFNLVLSPFMIVAGLAQGLAFLPYTVGTELVELNKGLIQAQAVTLDDSYRATFGVSIHDPRVHPRTGEVSGETRRFANMLEATQAFQRLLVSQGMPEEVARRHVLASIDTHTRSRGHILLTVVYRHRGMQPFTAVSKHTGIVTTFRPEHSGWREPYERDARGELIDEVVDWAGLEFDLLKQDKVVGMLMVLAAEAVKTGKRSPEYWQVERRWMAGETTEIIRESLAKVKLDGPRG
ncbi:MAG: hypothetical protein HYV61_06905 [Candidatus Rokubacteria bacterium]|nr:hypothetical protein [Candidatus Rokubacteria bacterium]